MLGATMTTLGKAATITRTLFILVVALAIEAAPAGGQAELPCDTAVSGSIVTPLDRVLYLLTAPDGGDRVRVDLARTGGDAAFTPRWRLLNGTTGQQVFDSGYACGNYPSNSSLAWSIECTVAAGTYRIEVANGDGTSVGTYELWVTRLVNICNICN